MCFRKGSPRHVLAGRIFVASMLTMGALAAYLAITRHQPNNIGGGILTFYLIGTAWLTARRKDGNEPFGLGCARDSPGEWHPQLDDWRQSPA